MTIKECIAGTVKFQFYRKNELYYRCENGFVFRVPIDATGDVPSMQKTKASCLCDGFVKR